MATNIVENGVNALEFGLHRATDAMRKTADEIKQVADLAAGELEETAKASIPSAVFTSGGAFLLLCGATTLFVAAGLAATRGRAIGALLIGGAMLSAGGIATAVGLMAAPRHPMARTRHEISKALDTAAEKVDETT